MFVYCHTLGLHRGSLIYANDHPIDYVPGSRGSPSVPSPSLHGTLAEFTSRCSSLPKTLHRPSQQVRWSSASTEIGVRGVWDQKKAAHIGSHKKSGICERPTSAGRSHGMEPSFIPWSVVHRPSLPPSLPPTPFHAIIP